MATKTPASTANGRAAAPRGPRAGASAALDVLLTDAALSPGASRRFLAPGATARLAGALARRPGGLARALGGLGAELGRIAAGSSQLEPAKGDRRFADRAWQESWLLHRLMQSYLALGTTVEGLIDAAELDWQAQRQVAFALGNVLDALAPTNLPLTNPQVIKETVDRGGANLLTGTRRLARDAYKRRLPAMVDTSRFEVGGNIAVTPGAVVHHDELFELIHYQPATERVYETPIVIVPPTINKYYILDLAPGRSIVEHLLAQGHQVFMVSWRNPEREHSHFDLDAYAAAVLEARDTVAEIARHRSAHVLAACSGGIITTGALGHLAHAGRLGEVASLTLLVCAIDNEQAGDASALATRELAAAAVAESARRGYLAGDALASVFAWLRPNDLIWNYAINNYWLGREPPAFDILYWNSDTVRMAAGLHRDFVKLALSNAMTRPGAQTVLGTPISLGQIEIDSYIVAGASDHIVPWSSAYRTTQLLGGEPRFVLSASGHIQALVNPPSPDSRSSYRIAASNPADAEQWEARALTHKGSWWPDYTEWLGSRSGALVPAPLTLGSRAHRARGRAPGTYVLAS
jgi:poly[(R)-3-hydroxyalkanoate] polymerase subunit PhaC